MINMFYPLYFISWKINLVLVAFIINVFLGMINDTLETQTGVTFYTLFYTLLVFSSKKE